MLYNSSTNFLFIGQAKDWKPNAKHQMLELMFLVVISVQKDSLASSLPKSNYNKKILAYIWCLVFGFQSSADSMKRSKVSNILS